MTGVANDIKRFGNYELDLSQIAAPSTEDLTFELEPEQEQTQSAPELLSTGTKKEALLAHSPHVHE